MIDKVLGLLMNGLVGIFFAIPILFAYALVLTVHLIISIAAGVASGTSSQQGALLTPGDIFFNKVPLTDINFFNFSDAGTTGAVLRNIIAEWFVIFMGIAIILLLFVLVYLGIKILISSAQGKAKYKEALTNWLVSVGILFSIQIFAIIVIGINNLFVSFIEKATQDGFENIFKSEDLDIFKNTIFNLIPKILIYGMIVRYTATFLFQYIKRMIKVAFLIIISPLISITYAVDKFSDKKAQALTNWTKQFTSEVLIQPFHALIYLILLSLSKSLAEEGGIFAGLMAVVFLRFIFEAEKIIKNIFDVKPAASMGDGNKVVNAIIGSKVLGEIKQRVQNIKPYEASAKVSSMRKFGKGEEIISPNGKDFDLRDKVKPIPVASTYETGNEDNEKTETPKYIENEIEDLEIDTLNQIDVPTEEIEEIEQIPNRNIQINKINEIPEKQKLNKKDQLKKAIKAGNKKVSFGFALAGGALEVGDEKDSITKNLTQGFVGGYAVGVGAEKLIDNSLKKHEVKKLQKKSYSNNINITSNELSKNASIEMALKGIDVDPGSDEAKKIFLDWMNKIEKEDTGSLAAAFEENKERLKMIYQKRDGLKEFEAEAKVEDLQEEVLALGTDYININEYDKAEKEMLSSMIDFKTKLEKDEVESLTSEVDKNPYEVVKANVIEAMDENKEIISTNKIKQNSDISTFSANNKLDKEYEERVKFKNKELDNKYKEYEENVEKYNEKFNKTTQEIKKEFIDSGEKMEDFKKDHDLMLSKIKSLEKNIKDIYKNDYNLNSENLKFKNIESKNVIEFIEGTEKNENNTNTNKATEENENKPGENNAKEDNNQNS